MLNLGCSIKSVLAFLEGRLFGLLSIFSDYYNIHQFNFQNISIHMFIGMSLLNRLDSIDLFTSLMRFCSFFSSFDFLHILNLHLVD